jgi:hypothetical protein
MLRKYWKFTTGLDPIMAFFIYAATLFLLYIIFRIVVWELRGI